MLNSHRGFAYEPMEGHRRITGQQQNCYTATALLPHKEGNGDCTKGKLANGHSSHSHAGLGVTAMPEIGEEKEKEAEEAAGV